MLEKKTVVKRIFDSIAFRYDLLNHLLHHEKLLQKLVDVLHRRSASLGDSPPSASIHQMRLSPLVFGHGVDDGLHPHHGLLVDLQSLERLPHSGDHLQNRLQRSHPLQLLELLIEII